MFTGIITALGSVSSLTPTPSGARLTINPLNCELQTANNKLLYHPSPGDSIAVNGVCLTHAPPSQTANRKPQTANSPLLSFDIIKETLSRTNLASLAPGSPVNLESSLRPDSPISGHFVQGHIDGIGRITHVSDDFPTSGGRLTIEVTPDLLPYIIPKGSITLDGVSLTIASVDPPNNTFTVALIPTTLQLTTLSQAKLNDHLNIETDILARTVVHYLRLQNELPTPSLTLGKLRNAGF